MWTSEQHRDDLDFEKLKRPTLRIFKEEFPPKVSAHLAHAIAAPTYRATKAMARAKSSMPFARELRKD